MSTNYSRPSGSRSGSLEVLDQPPSYTNRAYAPSRTPPGPAAAAAVSQSVAYGRRYQSNTAAGGGNQPRMYGELGPGSSDSSREQPRSRSQSPARLLETGHSSGGQQPGMYSERSRVPVSSGSQQRSRSPAGYLEEGAAAMQGYPASSPGSRYPPASNGRASVNAGYYSDAASPPQSYAPSGRLYSQRPYYPGYNATRYGRPKHVSVTREPGYYNLNTDTVVRAKKHRNKTFLYVGRPWSKGFSTAPRDFLPLAVVSIFFCPPVGIVALVFALMSRNSSRKEDYGAAGFSGRAAFWSSVAAVIVGVICWIVIVAAINDFRFIGHRIH